MTPGTQSIDFHGEELILHPEGVIWWPAEHSLILSDVHLGKSATFRFHGIPVPEGETDEDLKRIERLVAEFDAPSLIIVGDLIHSGTILTAAFMENLNHWFAELPCQPHLIRGNHDPKPKKLEQLPALGHANCRQIGAIHFVHDPADAPKKTPTITGHLHPLCRVGTKRGPKIRVPCFLHREHCLSLPAFGTFTSGRLAEASHHDDAFYPIAGGRVYPPSLI